MRYLYFGCGKIYLFLAGIIFIFRGLVKHIERADIAENGDEETTHLGAKRCVHLATCANLDSVA